MPKKTKIIFISAFLITILIILGVFFWINKNKTTTNGVAPWYQSFNPFGTGSGIGEVITDIVGGGESEQTQEGGGNGQISKFHQITDFAIAGATFLEETRPIETETETVPEQIKTIMDSNTKDGRKEIQMFLNKELSLTKPLVVDGNFGKLAIQAIKDFQKLKNIPVTGIVDEQTAPYFVKITESLFAQPKFEQVPSIRYVERKNGHIYKMFLDTKIKEKISNSTIPSIYEALFDGTGESVIYRYLSENNTISSFLATLGAPNGEFLPQNISDLSTSLDKNKFFYLTENSSGVTGSIGTFGEVSRNIVFSHPFTEWTSQWDGNQNVYLTTKPSYNVTGSMFLLNSPKKTISKIFGGVEGLTTLINHQGSFVLYSYTTNTGPKLGTFNIKEHSTFDFDTYGLPEKCVWANDNVYVYCAVPNVISGNQYPDSWYQGLVSFDDFFVKINTLTGDKETIANSADETPIDGTYLFLDKNETSLFFTNKKDSTLWSLDL